MYRRQRVIPFFKWTSLSVMYRFQIVGIWICWLLTGDYMTICILLDVGKIAKDMKYINYFDRHFIKIPCQFYAKHFI